MFYKTAPNNWENNIKKIATVLKIRIHKFHRQQTFIIVEGHKANSLNSLQYRLLNPSKNINGKNCERAYNYLKDAPGINQRCETVEATERFTNIKRK